MPVNKHAMQIFYTQKPHIFRADFPIVPVGAVVAARQKCKAFFLNISAQRADYNRGNAAPASGRMEGDRREAVVEDSSIAQAICNPCRRHQNFKRLTVNFSFITYGRTIGARTPLAFKNSPPFASERSPSLRREVQPAAEFQRLCLLK